MWNAPLSQIFRQRTHSFPLAQFLLRRSDSVSPLRVENEVRTSAGSRRPANALTTVHEYGSPEYNRLIPATSRKPGSRAAIVIDVYQVGSVRSSWSCGWNGLVIFI
ncbi:hypothetical protein EV363DRAFT_893104 [Boletus edulis]|uniref:Uncharacterized protein n=1 Tax=Boletus edulis BED1 TaxID=1328754 RepID=A0AAD4GHR9_BOLED|nr:hypothetical protein EV363DRAFT_893104 [Boletus edulis]KAF8444870.1 hypothetical protein L210DRAFT_3051104 [Boletus edulis BED1]